MSLEQIGRRAGRMLANRMRAPPSYHETCPSRDTGDLDQLKLPDADGNTIPNFSRVGYREGLARIPFIPVQIVVEPSLDPSSDDTSRIQEAIDAVAQSPLICMGEDGARIRGTVLLKAGTYRVAGAIVINASGTVLRGEGQDESGTIVIATGNIQRDFVLVNGMLGSEMGAVEMQRTKARTAEMQPINGYRGSKKPDTYTSRGADILVGSTQIPVESTKGYKIGDRIVIERPGCDEWIDNIRMNCLPSRPGNIQSNQWTAKTYTFRFERKIVAIDCATNTFTIDIPMVMRLDPKYPQARVYELIHKMPTVSDVGVENLRLVSEYDPCNPEDENHGWYAVIMDNTVHGWVADVTTVHFVSGIFAGRWSRYITIQDCSVLDPVSKPTEGGRRYQFNLSGQMGLVKRCYTTNARHDFITLGRICGPNVFVDSTGVNGNNDTGPHERWAMGTLYDNITCNTLNVRQRSWMGSGQGWAGVFHVIYNCTAHKSNNCFQDPPGATNWIIGFQGALTKRPAFEEPGKSPMFCTLPSYPRSLYWAQLIERAHGDIQYVKKIAGYEGKLQYPPRL
ncbi:hypothetical protein BGW38_004465 [Lunasporangiospora selenospora]|uniref:Pectate lyase superfamily protein n=1 Tax=Lunasporangiospora selenospora TaxID=979761 RepID=A0A9P6KHC8_9FUNG|nr:hypothetical protein BGW38_004465 [Lunasporangiospora selenospora]